MKTLKRCLRMVMAGILCVSALFFALFPAALAQEGQNAVLMVNTHEYNTGKRQTDDVASAASLADSLYMLTYGDVLKKWTPGQAEPVTVIEEMPRRDPALIKESGMNDAFMENPIGFIRIFSNETYVLGLDIYTGEVWALTDGTDGFEPKVAFALDWEGILLVEGDRRFFEKSISDACVIEGMLYMVMTDYNSDTLAPVLYRWEMATGKALPIQDDKYIQSICAYQEGKALCTVYDYMNAWDDETQTLKPFQLAVLDLASGECTPLLEVKGENVYGLCYNAENDTAYYMSQGVVYSVPGMALPVKVSAYLPMEYWTDGSCGLLSGTMYYAAGYNGVSIRALGEQDIEGDVLKIAYSYNNQMHNRFLRDHPDASVTLMNDYFETLEKFAGQIVSGENDKDIYALNTSNTPLSKLMDKGYALKLSGNAEIKKTMDEMYPAFVEACSRDGELYALPHNVYGATFGYNTEVWDELGFSEDELPKSWMELFQMAADWDAEEYPDINFFDDLYWKDTLGYWLDRHYFAYLKRENLPISFETELYLSLLGKLNSISRDETVDEDEYWQRPFLFALHCDVFRQGNVARPIALPFAEGMEPMILATLEVLTVSPKTTRADAALSYLAGILPYYEEEGAYLSLFPGHNDPVPNRNFEIEQENWTKECERLRGLLEKAKPEEVASLRENLAYMEEALANAENHRYNVTAEAIADYRENIAPYLYVAGMTPFDDWAGNGSELSALRQQYRDGAISAEQYSKELSKRLRMSELEDQ